ncbi:LysR family transcriptional regulator, partial [Acinetobacter baumannii]|nr:LysR family transcriptional regulator [Acinetobacter baumannii]
KRVDIRQLLYFTTIAEEGSISAAAKKLHLSQPPLSYQMKLLEEELHLPLIERSARGIALTEAGRVLYKRAQGILELSELTRKEMLA